MAHLTLFSSLQRKVSAMNSNLKRLTSMAIAGLLVSAGSASGQIVVGTTQQDFDHPGTNFGAFGDATAPVAAVTGNAAQLTAQSNGQEGRIGFDGTLTSSNVDFITGSFDFRADPVNPPNQADGFSLYFIPTSGPDGQGTSGDFSFSGAAELGQMDGALGIGFNIHAGGGSISDNSITIANDATELTEINAPFDISTPEFHQALFRLDFLGSGDALLDLSLVEDINGSASGPSAEQVVFSDFNISGLTPYDFRVGFAGRTGGQNALQQIDNINVSAQRVPEPASIAIWALVGLAGLGISVLRRRTGAS